jgi:hypothetical protein
MHLQRRLWRVREEESWERARESEVRYSSTIKDTNRYSRARTRSQAFAIYAKAPGGFSSRGSISRTQFELGYAGMASQA